MNTEIFALLQYLARIFVAVGILHVILCIIFLPWKMSAQFAISATLSFGIGAILYFLIGSVFMMLMSGIVAFMWFEISGMLIYLEN